MEGGGGTTRMKSPRAFTSSTIFVMMKVAQVTITWENSTNYAPRFITSHRTYLKSQEKCSKGKYSIFKLLVNMLKNIFS